MVNEKISFNPTWNTEYALLSSEPGYGHIDLLGLTRKQVSGSLTWYGYMLALWTGNNLNICKTCKIQREKNLEKMLPEIYYIATVDASDFCSEFCYKYINNNIE